MADDIMFVIGVDDRDLIKAQKEQLKFQRNLTTIEKAFRAGDITAGRYNAELAKQARQLQTLGGSYNQASSEVRKYAYALRQADDATLSQAQAMGFAGKSINRLGANMQQAGYQIGDFAVQVQGGTNVMVALGQQGAQLLGIFGAGGAIAGAGLAITTAFLAPLMKTKEEASKATESVDTLADSLKKLTSIMEEYANAKRAASLGITVDELLGVDTVEKAAAALKSATEELEKLNRARAAASLLGGIGILGLGGTGDLNEAKKNVEEAERLLAEVRAKVRQEAREKAEAILNDQYEQQQRDQALAEYNAGQAAIAERVSWVEGATKIFRDAQKKMRDEEVAETERSLDRLFRNRTLLYSIRFSGDADVMSQSLTPSTKGMKPTQSYQELIAMGWSPEDLERIGVKAPRKSGGSKKKAPKDPAAELEKFMAQQEQANALQKQGIMLGEESVRVTELINKYKEAGVTLDLQRIQNLAAEEQRLETLQYAHDSLTNALMSVVDGTKSVGDAFKGLIVDMLLEIYRQQVAKNFASTVLGLFGFANGGVFSGGSQVKAFADGGVVGSPTYFPMSGGKTGLMGEAGPEAIMPLKRGANGKLGVQMEGGGDSVVVNQNINISTGVQQTVRNEIKSLMPQISEQAKSAVLDAKRRGGSYGGKF